MRFKRQFKDKYAGSPPERIYCLNSVRLVFFSLSYFPFLFLFFFFFFPLSFPFSLPFSLDPFLPTKFGPCLQAALAGLRTFCRPGLDTHLGPLGSHLGPLGSHLRPLGG